MKRFLSILLVCTMLFCLCGCRNNDSKRDRIEEDLDKDVQSGKVSLGVTEDGIYTNEFLGLSCTLPDGWEFYSRDQILETNNLVGDMAGDELAEMLENAAIIYDMYASHPTTYSSININMEKISALQAASLDLKETLESQFETIESSFTNMGYNNIQIEYTKVAVDGHSFDGVKLQATIQGVEFYEIVFSFQKSNYIANVTVGTLKTDTTADLLACFSVK